MFQGSASLFSRHMWKSFVGFPCRFSCRFSVAKRNTCRQYRGRHISSHYYITSSRHYISSHYSAVVPSLRTMKLDSAEFHSLFTPELRKLTELFEKYHHELRIAGGAVRDLLSGQQPHDVDFATTATPDEMMALFEQEQVRMINMKGEKHGTVTCRINDQNFEVTTLRIDVETDGRHAEVQFTKDWQLDALRRDLTINSMFLGLDGTVYDYFQGREDLEQKKVRFVGEARDRIQEDYLRILRYFRFYGRIASDPDLHEPETLEAIRENMAGLGGISGERIWVEVKKILTGHFAAPLVRTMLELGMASYIGLPEKANIAEFERVWDRSLHLDPAPITLLAALMDSDKEVYALHERVKMSREELRGGLFITEHRRDDLGSDPVQTCKHLQCDSAGKDPKTKERIHELLKYLGQEATLKAYSAWKLPKFPVNGHKLLERGVAKGPALARMLSALRHKWKESDFVYTEEDLLEFVEELKETV